MRAEIESVLKSFKNPETGEILDLRPHVTITKADEKEIHYVLEVTPAFAKQAATIKQAIDIAFSSISINAVVKGVMTAHSSLSQGLKKPLPKNQFSDVLDAMSVGKWIAVASGKGGVGKSTTTLNLAVALAQNGLRVGVLDADIYGPSLPTLLGVSGKPEVTPEKKIIPIRKFGLEAMSIGFLVPPESAMVWRGPMVQGALFQLLKDVMWGPLDCMLIDMPPGTGDAHLTIAQNLPLSGAIVVSTPQDIALADAVRALTTFEKLHVPILGMIQNMSIFVCPHCGEGSHVFGKDGLHKEAEKRGLTLLADIPLDLSIRDGNDKAVPVATEIDLKMSVIYRELAKEIWKLVTQNSSDSSS